MKALYNTITESFNPSTPLEVNKSLSNNTTIHYSFDMAQQVCNELSDLRNIPTGRPSVTVLLTHACSLIN